MLKDTFISIRFECVFYFFNNSLRYILPQAPIASITGLRLLPCSVSSYSTVIFEAATDGKNQLRYLVGAANGEYERRLQLGAETFHQELDKAFFGKQE